LNLTLTGCSSAEPASVSVQQYKIQISNLYLQPVKIPSHLPSQRRFFKSGQSIKTYKTAKDFKSVSLDKTHRNPCF